LKYAKGKIEEYAGSVKYKNDGKDNNTDVAVGTMDKASYRLMIS
jgi:hypothetical protein